nr:glycosyltransferase family 2 protein [Methylonatrum kenyense]
MLYIYLGYPLLLAILARSARPVALREDHRPRVSILIPAYNEAAVIEQTLHNKLDLDYPADRLEILVVSDAADDGTDAIVESIAAGSRVRLHLFRQSSRQGKTAGLNRLVDAARGEVVAFSDANSIWAQDALAKLVRNFADPTVGYVSGRMLYTHPDGSLVGDGSSAFMRYENWLWRQETAVGSVVGVDGGIDAMRRDLYQPLAANQLPDFVQPLKVVEAGYRVIHEPDAVLREPALDDSGSEFGMRVRVTLRALHALRDMAHLMNPLARPLFALQLISHKLLRYLAFLPLLAALLSNLVLLADGGIYLLAAAAQIGFYGVALQAHGSRGPLPRWRMVPFYFTLLNLACARAAYAYLRGEQRVTWTPREG